ncbi:hypothetical protein MMC13_008431 [Lambiella insularis]|nr:hypothetical protein [Lambiella insularis]
MLFLSFIFLCVFGSVTAAPNYGFTYPNVTDPTQKNMVMELGQAIDIKWRVPFSTTKLAFIAENGTVLQFFNENNNGNSLSWTVNVNNSGSSSPFYYLYLENEANSSQNYYSALFRVNDQANAKNTAAATTTTRPHPTQSATVTTSTHLSTATSSTTALSTASASATTNPTPIPTPSSGLSPSAKLGIGLGVPLGVLALLGLAILAVWSSRRRSRAAKGDPEKPNRSGYAPHSMAPAIVISYDGRPSVSDRHSAYDQESIYSQHTETLLRADEYASSPVHRDELPEVYELPHERGEARGLEAQELDGYPAAHGVEYWGAR